VGDEPADRGIVESRRGEQCRERIALEDLPPHGGRHYSARLGCCLEQVEQLAERAGVEHRRGGVRDALTGDVQLECDGEHARRLAGKVVRRRLRRGGWGMRDLGEGR